jgi:hypothetical protein
MLANQHGIEVVNEAGLARMLEATDARFDPAALEKDSARACWWSSVTGKRQR